MTLIARKMSVIIPGSRWRNFLEAALQEHPATVQIDRRAEDRRNVRRSRKGRGGQAKLRLHHFAPLERRDAEEQRQPQPVSEHLHTVPVVTVVCTGLFATRAAGGPDVRDLERTNDPGET